MNYAPDNNKKKLRPILLGVLGAFVALVITGRLVLSPVVL